MKVEENYIFNIRDKKHSNKQYDKVKTTCLIEENKQS